MTTVKEVVKHWRKTKAYRLWKAYVIRRDGKCMCCGDRKGRHAHHIRSAKYYPALKFTVSNGITLCKFCHMFVHTKIASSYRHTVTETHLKALLSISPELKTLRKARERAKDRVETLDFDDLEIDLSFLND